MNDDDERRLAGEELWRDHHMAKGYASGLLQNFLYCESVPDAERAAACREFLELVASKAAVFALLESTRGLDLATTITLLRQLKPYPVGRPRLHVVKGGVS